MLTLYRRGRIWWARGSVRGRRIRKTLDTQFRREAEFRIQELERELYSGKRIRAVKWKTFESEFIASIRAKVKPSTLRKYEFICERFGPFVDCIQHASPSAVAAYLDSRKIGREGLKSDQRILHRILAYAVKCGYLETNPVEYKNLNSRSRNTQPFSHEEIACMLADSHRKARPDLPTIITTFVYTGLRISDICGLERREVDFASHQIIRRTQKRNKVVAIPMHPALESGLHQHLESGILNPKSSYVFPTSTGRMTLPETMDHILRRLWKRCGIDGAHSHRFRTTMAVQMLNAGASLFDVSKLLGITVAVAERHYAPFAPELRERIGKIIRSIEVVDVK